ncbi:hypothetical protein [Pseudopontixanthobacter vadosimaris]|uniref:hypothetical protein n=1 Tax=Pseudopontixanthobacter vadosimaris TaxID=2726450 RepID=UPI001472DFF7|nr:hypothetical protein [Pseudopontixanthobacter vadosimaris]
MSELNAIQIVALLGWLVLVGSALAAYRLSWRRSVLYLLIWGSIFALAVLMFGLIT